MPNKELELNALSFFGSFLKTWATGKMLQERQAATAGELTPVQQHFMELAQDVKNPPQVRSQAHQQLLRLLDVTPDQMPPMSFEMPEEEGPGPAKMAVEAFAKKPEEMMKAYSYFTGEPMPESPLDVAEKGAETALANLRNEQTNTERTKQRYYGALAEYNQARATGQTRSNRIPDEIRVWQTQLKDQAGRELKSLENSMRDISYMMRMAFPSTRDSLMADYKRLAERRDKVLGELRNLSLFPPGSPYWTPQFKQTETDTTAQGLGVGAAGIPGGGQLPYVGPGKPIQETVDQKRERAKRILEFHLYDSSEEAITTFLKNNPDF